LRDRGLDPGGGQGSGEGRAGRLAAHREVRPEISSGDKVKNGFRTDRALTLVAD